MKFVRFQKIANVARIYIIRYRLQRKLIDLQALSAQQVSDLYLGNVILGEIRTLQKKLDTCLLEENLFPPRSAHGSEKIG
jgi:hypothetical protein